MKNAGKLICELLFSMICCINSVYAEDVSHYVGMVQNGTYQLEYKLDYNIQENGQNNRHLAEGTLAESRDKGMDYFDIYQFSPNEKYQYSLLKIKNVYDMTYYVSYADKKVFAKSDIKEIDKISKKDKYYSPRMANFIEYKNKWKSEILSMLGPITEGAGVLGIYKVKYIGSGTELQKGSYYNYDEYSIERPYRAGLRLYYLNHKLVKCIKIMKENHKAHWLFSGADIVQDGYVVLDIENFIGEVTVDSLGQ